MSSTNEFSRVVTIEPWSDGGIAFEVQAGPAELAALARIDRQPMPDELLDADGNAKEVWQDPRQPLGVPHMSNERAGMKELRHIRHRVAIAKRGGRETNERPDVDAKAVGVRTISIDVRLRLGPGLI